MEEGKTEKDVDVVEAPEEPVEPVEEEAKVDVEPEEEECKCFSVDPPESPWKQTFTFGTYDCGICGRRVKKRREKK